MDLTLVKMKGEATCPSPYRQGLGPLAEPVADARGSEIPGNSAKVSDLGLVIAAKGSADEIRRYA